ncbi:MAG: recombinase family protein [Spirochaetaceae bacterium]|nr:recombinase family protein [Spirochaetaceae bacterium]
MADISKRAWIYTRIDAPEDTHGVLKSQEKELYDYAGQMGFSIAGTSSDLGCAADMDRPGLARLAAAALHGRFDALLIQNTGRLSRDQNAAGALIRRLGEIGIEVYSPLEGMLNSEMLSSLDRLQVTQKPEEASDVESRPASIPRPGTPQREGMGYA